VVRRRDGVGVEGDHDAGHAGEQAGNDVGAGDDAAGVDSGKPRGFLVAADGEQIAAVNRAVQHDPQDGADDDQQNERHRDAEKFSAGDAAQDFETFPAAEAFGVVVGDEAGDAAIE
jgi:hypothetical protein